MIFDPCPDQNEKPLDRLDPSGGFTAIFRTIGCIGDSLSSGEFEATDPATGGKTYHDLDKRLLGGYTGGSEPNSISLTRFRSIAGCCVGTGPIALGILWKNVVTEKDGILTVNLHTDKENADYALSHKMPDEGVIALTLKKNTSAGFRI